MIAVSKLGRARGHAIRFTLCLAVLAAALGGPSTIVGAEEPGRYSMTPTADGALRLDSRTGAVSACTRKEDAWECTAVADDLLKLQSEIDRLAAEKQTLQAEIDQLKLRIEAQEKKAKAERERSWLPDQQDVERVMAYFREMMRRVQDKVESLWEKAPKTGA